MSVFDSPAPAIEPSAAVSDYQRVGGGPVVRAVVDRFYELVLGDRRLAGFFGDSDLTSLKRHQALLITQVLGGPTNYAGRDLREAHAGLGIRRGDFSLVVMYLAQALKESGASDDVLGRVGDALAGTEPEVVGLGEA
jgi:hemoglobin